MGFALAAPAPKGLHLPFARRPNRRPTPGAGGIVEYCGSQHFKRVDLSICAISIVGGVGVRVK
jgi:hypothetical protein